MTQTNGETYNPNENYIFLEGDHPPYDYDNIRHFLEIYRINDLLEFSNGEHDDVLGDLRLIRGEHMNIIVLPNNDKVHINLDNIANYDLEDPDILSHITYNANYEYSDFHKKLMPSYTSSTWGDVEWFSNYEPVKTMSIGGSTDFYDKFKLWPHYAVEGKRKMFTSSTQLLPLEFLAEIIVDGRHAYIFYDVNFTYYEKHDLTYNSLFKHDELGNPVEGAYAVLFEDSQLPSWIEMVKLKDSKNLPLANSDARYVNETKLPYAPGWIGDDETPTAPFNYFLTQIDEFDEVVFGDEASLYVFWNKEDTGHILLQSK